MDKSNITLHIRYKEPIRMNGFLAETDTITFADREELIKYVKGEPAYDVLDDIVRKKDNELLLYADNANGDILWRAVRPGQRMFVDMDGTLAVFRPVECLETLYEPGYFQNLEPQEHVVEAVRKIVREHPEMEVYVMSSVLSDSRYAQQEKNAWLDQFLPEIDQEHRIFPPCGENKLDYVPGGIRDTDHKLPDHTDESVVAALDRLERRWGTELFRKVFKSITVDNGSEFKDVNGLERSISGEGKRTKMYYCHPYSSWERGTNEVTNKMVRRKVPKGSDFDDKSDQEIEKIAEWINNYPRRIHGYRTAAELFQEEIEKLA